MGHPTTIEEIAALRVASLNERFSDRVKDNDSLEMVLSANAGDLTADFFTYDWAKRKRKDRNPTIHYTKFNLTGDNALSIKSAYQVMRRALLENGYFIEENEIGENVAGLLLQPLVADASSISLLANDFIAQLRSEENPVLEPPKLNGSRQSYVNWLRKYHEVNGIPLIKGVPVPEYLNRLDNTQLSSMFYGINNPKLLEQRLRERQFVVEFYKAQGAMLPEGFDRWGHNQVGQLYLKLNRWYVKDNPANPQLPLFIE